jgi:DNA-directed RNA polymerase specialized sigma24 family protein
VVHLQLQDYTYDEIAAALRVTVDAVKSRLRDAKKSLRARLGDAEAFPEVIE